jgi:transposase
MAKGKAVSLEKRHDVVHARRNLKLSPVSIRDLYFIDPDGNYSIALRTVEKMCRLIDQPSPDDMNVDIFLEGPKTVRLGRPRMLVGQDVSFLRRLYNRVAPRGKMKDMHKLFTKSYYAVGSAIPSQSTVSRTIRKRTGLTKPITRKKLQRIHRDRDPHRVLTFVERAAPYDPEMWIDIDEMKQTPADFLQLFGYALEGEPATAQQIYIGTRAFSVIAAMGVHGFICWTIFEENLNHTHVEEFVRTKVQPLMNGQRGLIDNAGSHHADDVRAALDTAFNGQWLYASPYSPHLKPIERGFSLIKGYLRDHEDEAVLGPVLWINRAFERYAVGGEHGDSCFGFWNTYRRLHRAFQDGRI